MHSRLDPVAILETALKHRSHQELADFFDVSVRQLRRYLAGEGSPNRELLSQLAARQSTAVRETPPSYTFIDLFAGIGGLRRGFEPSGKCVFTSEWDRFANLTYEANFPVGPEGIWGDITTKAPDEIPDHDILLAGFPCQPFSLAGVSKKNSLGRAHGFLDETQGTLFFNIVRILQAKEPRAFLLENVKNLRSHDGGKTYRVIMASLRKLGYQVFDKVIDASPWVPQRRQRIFIVGFRTPVSFSFDEMAIPAKGPRLASILHNPKEEPEARFTSRVRGRTTVDKRYTLSDHLWGYLQEYASKHQAAGNGFGCSVFGPEDVARTLSARYHKDGSEILIAQKGRNPRRLTPRECARLMGFDLPGRQPFGIPPAVSDTQAYRQFGNAVVVPVVEELARLILPRVLAPERYPPAQAEQLEFVRYAAD